MQLRIVLVYSFIFTNVDVCRAADSDAQDEQKLRRKVGVSDPSMKGDIITPLNVKSSNVPLFSAYDHQFTTYYKMTCGSLVTALTGVIGNARLVFRFVFLSRKASSNECLRWTTSKTQNTFPREQYIRPVFMLYQTKRSTVSLPA
ncbi:hypothetical protein COOONC_12109 [Cooperia oncophora]